MDDIAAGLLIVTLERQRELYARTWEFAFGAWWHVAVGVPVWTAGLFLPR